MPALCDSRPAPGAVLSRGRERLAPARRPTTRGTRKTAPALARTTFGLNGSTVPAQQITPVTPVAPAMRRAAPRLPGSRTSTQTTTRRRACSSLKWERPVGLARKQLGQSPAYRLDDRAHRLRAHGVGDPVHDPGTELEDRHSQLGRSVHHGGRWAPTNATPKPQRAPRPVSPASKAASTSFAPSATKACSLSRTLERRIRRRRR